MAQILGSRVFELYHDIHLLVNLGIGVVEVSQEAKHFSIDVTVTVHLSPTFYAWLFQYAGEMTIVEPEGIREAYAERLQTAIDDVLGE